MTCKFEEASAMVSEIEDPRKRAFLSFGLMTALMGEEILRVDPNFDLHRMALILGRMFDKTKVLEITLFGDFRELQWWPEDDDD